MFSKLGCADKSDKYSHYKMVTAVGVVMGIHAMYSIFVGGVEVTGSAILRYLPVSALYIISMAIGYIGLRYIELSISSPICNSSGAIVAVICLITGQTLAVPQYIAVALVCIAVIALGFVEANEDDELRALRQEKSNYKYSKSALAIVLPLIYCLLDALGTFADSIVLETLDEDVANTAYELTFLILSLSKSRSISRKKKLRNMQVRFSRQQVSSHISMLSPTPSTLQWLRRLSRLTACFLLYGAEFSSRKSFRGSIISQSQSQ